jgi:hypothetical protein
MSHRLPRLAVIATAAGVFSGLFGVGGGALIVALLVLWLDYDERVAAGTSLAAICIIAVAAAAVHGLLGNVDLVKGLLVGVPAVGGVIAGTWLQQRISTRAIAGLLAGLLFVSAAVFVL